MPVPVLPIRYRVAMPEPHSHEFHISMEIPALPPFPPAYLLRTPLEKRFAWRDFLAIKHALAQSAQ